MVIFKVFKFFYLSLVLRFMMLVIQHYSGIFLKPLLQMLVFHNVKWTINRSIS